ncbi:hypothetical protein BH10PLA2_BH10PLA2_31600 [soil metagenome]
MTLGRVDWLVGVALLVMVVNVGLSVLYKVVFGHWIDPGHEEQYYHDHIQVAAPYSSIIAGFPLMFLAGWWVSRWWGGESAIRAALVVWLTYALIDIGVVLAAGPTARIAVLSAVSVLTKLGAVYLGAVVACRRSETIPST